MEPTNSIPFEDTAQPFMARFLRTVGMAFSDPMRLFSDMSGEGIGLPLLYGVIVGTVTTVFAVVWNMMFGGLGMLAREVDPAEFAISGGMYIVFLFLSPLLVTVGMFVSAALFHLSLLVLGDGKRGFAVTFRAVAYGNTPGLLGVVPLCGSLVGGIWAIVLVIIAGKLGQGTDWWRSILGYFLPLIVCCCLAGWLATTLGLLSAFAN